MSEIKEEQIYVYCLFSMESGIIGYPNHNLHALWLYQPTFKQVCNVFGIQLQEYNPDPLKVIVDVMDLISEYGDTLQKLVTLYRDGKEVSIGNFYYRLRKVECGKNITTEMYG